MIYDKRALNLMIRFTKGKQQTKQETVKRKKLWKSKHEDLPHGPSGQCIVNLSTLVLTTILLGIQQVRTLSNIFMYDTCIVLTFVVAKLVDDQAISIQFLAFPTTHPNPVHFLMVLTSRNAAVLHPLHFNIRRASGEYLISAFLY